MVILGIETSCDETALSLIDAKTQMRADRTQIDVDKESIAVTVLADKTLSQIEIHREYGGVFPNLAKREHNRNLILLLEVVLTESGFGNPKSQIPRLPIGGQANHRQIPNSKLEKILSREPELLLHFLEYIPTIEKPSIGAIAVTVGPGLEPCLWTGVNFAKALALVWDIPIVPVNHMEGHIVSTLLRRTGISNSPNYLISNEDQNPKSKIRNAIRYALNAPQFPALALLISGGHTELVLIRDYFKYEIIGRTRDDAVGEAFDKVARLLGLPYPGGPEISRLAEQARQTKQGLALCTRLSLVKLPRPMLNSNNFDFSFSGLKTAVLYLIKKLPTPLTVEIKAAIAKEFEDAVTEVLVAKTKKAIQQYNNKTILIGGGVIANKYIRNEFEKVSQEMGVPLFIPEPSITTDNALMIAVAGFLRLSLKNGLTKPQSENIVAQGNLRLDKR